MGVDFIRRTARSFHKGLDRRRIELASPNLFVHSIRAKPRTYSAQMCSGQRIEAGEKLGVRLEGQLVVAMRGLDPVATISSPTGELLEALADGHREASCVVQEVHEMARVVEIWLC